MLNSPDIVDFKKLGRKYRGNPIFLHLHLAQTRESENNLDKIDVTIPKKAEIQEDAYSVPEKIISIASIFSIVDFIEYFKMGAQEVLQNEEFIGEFMSSENEIVPDTTIESDSDRILSDMELPESIISPQDEGLVLSNFESQDQSDTEEEFIDFVSWLSSLNKKNTEEIRSTVKEASKFKEDHFIESRDDNNSSGEVELKSDLGEPASESLAELLYSQGYRTEAIKMYELLMLRIPKKSTTFAARIKEIKVSKK